MPGDVQDASRVPRGVGEAQSAGPLAPIPTAPASHASITAAATAKSIRSTAILAGRRPAAKTAAVADDLGLVVTAYARVAASHVWLRQCCPTKPGQWRYGSPVVSGPERAATTAYSDAVVAAHG